MLVLDRPAANPDNQVHILGHGIEGEPTCLDHCLAMKDLSYLGTMLTNDEVAKLRTQAGQAEMKANVNGCISEYDPKEIVANRKAAMEYCFQLNNTPTNRQLIVPGRQPGSRPAWTSTTCCKRCASSSSSSEWRIRRGTIPAGLARRKRAGFSG